MNTKKLLLLTGFLTLSIVMMCGCDKLMAPDKGPDPYFTGSVITSVHREFSPFGSVISQEVCFIRELTNGGEAGEVFISVVVKDEGVSASKVFRMDKGEHVEVQACFYEISEFASSEWTARAAQSGDASHGNIKVIR